jgi:hypothetical protein
MNKEKDLADFKNLLHRLETEGIYDKSGTSTLLDIIAPEAYPYKTRRIVQEIIAIVYDNPEFTKMIPDNLKDFFSGYILPESEEKMSKAKELIKLMERLPSGFSIEEFNVNAPEDSMDFKVSFPSSAAKDFIPPEGNTIILFGVCALDVYYEKPYRGSIEGPPGGGWDIGISYQTLYFEDEDGNQEFVAPHQNKAVVNFLKKNFEDEFLDKIEKEYEEERTAYRGD